MAKLTLKGHVLTIHCPAWEDVLALLSRYPVPQAQIAEEENGNGYTVSRPLPLDERSAYAFLYKRNEKAAKKDEEPDPLYPGPQYA